MARARTFFRIVSHCPPPEDSFWSAERAGRQPRPEERRDGRLYRGISVWDTLEAAEELVRHARTMGWSRMGTAVVELTIGQNDPAIQVHKTRGKGHYTLIAEPAVLLARARPETCHVVQ